MARSLRIRKVVLYVWVVNQFQTTSLPTTRVVGFQEGARIKGACLFRFELNELCFDSK
jgi:hypothetical protein